ncbi:MAG: hypothetical protein Q8Q33_01635 [Chlamydiota bacterium]|nr:hypothetical protein [Chlamydiota bacterium]
MMNVPSDKTSLKIPIKISSHDVWMVSKADYLDVHLLRCRIERNILPQTEVQIVMMLPSEEENKKISKKIECKGIVQKTEYDASQPKEQCYKIEVLLSELSKIARKIITTVMK